MLLSAIRSVRKPVGPRNAENASLVRVCGGYSPDVVRARAGAPIRVTFLREEAASCSERVVFPAFGKSAMLPRGQRIVVDLPACPPGIYEFSCALKMLRGTLVVE